jgi:hypothetical protein
MSRGLNATQIGYLNQSSYSSEILIEIFGSSFLFYTTGFSDVGPITTGSYATPHTFLANNQMSIVGNLVEKFDPLAGEFTLQISTTSSALINALANNFLKTRIVAYKMFRDNTTNAADTTNLIQLYDSYVSDCNIQGGQDSITIELKSRSALVALDTVRGRTNIDIEPPLGVQIVWGTIQWQK